MVAVDSGFTLVLLNILPVLLLRDVNPICKVLSKLMVLSATMPENNEYSSVGEFFLKGRFCSNQSEREFLFRPASYVILDSVIPQQCIKPPELYWSK